tara:strand:+ start:377 stop:733 length:357 start_codon:yes stop_codon:yes gene_type:complete
MGLAQSLERVAGTVIAKFGGDVTVRYVSAGAYNTTTGVITESASDTDVKGVLEDVSVREINELVQQGDKRLTVAAKDLPSAPETKDRVVISTIVHQIIRVETTEQDNTAITHELILRA